MFFESAEQIFEIAKKTGTAVFVMPDDAEIPENKDALVIKPEKTVISIDQVRDVLAGLNTKQFTDKFIVIRPADLLSEESANALLKNLEEPKNHVHFMLISGSPGKLLPTILSRSSVYFLQEHLEIDGDIKADEKSKDLAKRLLVAKPTDLPSLAEEISKKKDGARIYALEILAITIEMLYKSYYKTGKMAFVEKIPRFLKTYENIEKNGNVKLHIVADLL